QQVREMAGSGLVELASHSHGLHKGVLANPQGNLQPSAGALIYDPATGRYETVEAQRLRIEQDLRTSRELIERHTGVRVRAMVWPYGAFTQPALDAAARAGMPITLTLEEGPNTADVPLSRIRRSLAIHGVPVPDYTVFRAPQGDGIVSPLNCAMHVDLDYVFDPDPVQQEANLSLLLERVQAVGPHSVFLQAFADPDGDGAADALYFPNRHLPVRADLFNRAAWQLRTRTGVQVYAWMPVMAFRLPAHSPLANRLVEWTGGDSDDSLVPHAGADGARYHRLTPFDSAVREVIGDIYEDLARHAVFAGILFHDDALLGDDEDNSAAALDTYARWGLPRSIQAIRADPQLSAQWAKKKTRFLTDITLALAGRVDYWRPGVLTARNLYARPVMQPETGAWFSQSFPQSLQAYDYTVVMAMPYMEGADDPLQWLTELVRQVAAKPDGLARTIFELQARDWNTGQPVPDDTLARQWSLLHRLGAHHLAYYPDDFHKDQPSLAVARRAISVCENLQKDADGLNTPPALIESRRTGYKPEETSRSY
nr:poly-beta-1,6-N-acetyl-D-glucosamine N-deacetylase PgaB [Pseudomonas sp.]